MTIILGIAAGLILLGLVMCFLCKSIDRPPFLSRVVYFVGIVLVIVGLILLLTPILIWVYSQLVVMFGQPGVQAPRFG